MALGLRVLLAAVSFLLATSASADFQAGLRAEARGRPELAFWEWLLLAQRGDPAAEFRLASAYYFGEGVPGDYERAAGWYRRAAEHGHAGARFNLGLMYDLGRGLPQDRARAAFWYRLAAEQGHPHAQHNLAVLERNGRGVPRDLADAARWYLRAAEQGHVPAQIKAALMYEDGEGVAADPVQAYKWYAVAVGHLAGTERDEIALLMRALRPRLTASELAEAQRLAAAWRARPEPRERTAPVWPRAIGRAVAAARSVVRGAPVAREGIGVVVDAAGHVLTNGDLVAGCREVRARPAAGDPRIAAVVARDTESDLALLRIAPAAHAAVLGTGDPADGEAPVAAFVASPDGLAERLVSPAAVRGEPGRFLLVSPAVPTGIGAPLLDASGRVLGVLVGPEETERVSRASDTAPGAASFAIPARLAWSFLEAHGVEAAATDDAIALAPAALLARAREFTLTVECRR